MASLTDMSSVGMLGFFLLPSHWEIIIIVVVILLLFGGKKLPELARGLGRGLRSFKDEIKGVKTGIKDVDKDVKEIGKDVKEMKESQSSKGHPDQHDQP